MTFERLVLEPEPMPPSASVIFGAQLHLAEQFASLLVSKGDELGLLGPRELPRLWSRHILNSAIIGRLLEAETRVVDIGSGAGFPGIPMAIARPDVHFTLVEPMERRANWLSSVVTKLGLQNVAVIRARAEDLSDSSFDVATARAVAPTEKLLKLLVPLVRTSTGGRVIAIKGQRVVDEIAAAGDIIQSLKLAELDVVVLGESEIPETVTLLVARLRHRE